MLKEMIPRKKKRNDALNEAEAMKAFAVIFSPLADISEFRAPLHHPTSRSDAQDCRTPAVSSSS